MSSNIGRRYEAAEQYRPDPVEYLLVAEAPPIDESRYFFFEDVPTGDSLYLEVAKAQFLSLRTDRLRSEKARFLERMRMRGIWLIDLSEEPVPDGSDKNPYLTGCVDSLIERCAGLDPRRVILLASSVYDVAHGRMAESGVPVIDVRMPFPGSGRQKEFRAGFWDAMTNASWNPDPVVVDGNCISYWLDALDHISAPEQDDKLAPQRLSLVRMFYHWPWVLSYTQGVRAEVEEIGDPERLRRHEQWMDIHLRELPEINGNIVEPLRDQVIDFGVNGKDAAWLAEAIAIEAPLVVTWDQALLSEAAGLNGIEVISPEPGWEFLSVPPGTRPRIAPSSSNPLSQQKWWQV